MPIYLAFNYVECAVWCMLGIFFGFRAVRYFPQNTALCLTAMAAAVAFGLSDYLEAASHGAMTRTTWSLKLVAGLTLFACLLRYQFLQHGRKALSPLRFVAAGVILVLALWLMSTQG